ncbi:ADP-ribosyltransferase, partial [Streptomyces sp. bgisy154]|uniref:ADP-ribosyltransferase n=1 Tax=Streptomyces sp. bgisy154 TaxID=3413794 RepID=UPI003D71A85E
VTTVLTGGAGAGVSGAGKAGAVAKVLSAAGKAGKVIDPMTYVAKGAGAGLSKIGDISKALKGVGNIEVPHLPDGSIELPTGHGLDPNGNLLPPTGSLDTPTVPHSTTPAGLPSHWTIQTPEPTGFPSGAAHTADGGVPAAGAHTPAPDGAYGQGAPHPTSTPTGAYGMPHSGDGIYGGTPHPTGTGAAHPGTTPSPWYHDTPATGAAHDVPATTPHETPTATPHTGGHDLPVGHTDDAAHGAGHGDDAVHTGDQADDASHTGDHADAGDHTGLGDDVVDTGAHHGTDASTAPGHTGTDVPGHPGAGGPFEYQPHMSADDFDNLATDAEKHAVAEAELAHGTNPGPRSSNAAGLAYGNAYWNDFLDNLPDESREALRTYSGNEYDLINSHLRMNTPLDDSLKHTIEEMDRVMDARPVPEDIMVVRGTGVDHIKIDGQPLKSPADMEGGVFDDKAFTSTALGKSPPPPFDQKPVWMHLRVAKGTPALWIDHLSKYPGERELLLAKGSEYKVTRVFMDQAGKWHVYGEILPRP